MSQSREPAIFGVACDMPQLKGELIRHLISLSEGVDAVVPRSASGFEPLHAYYGKGCLPALEELMQGGDKKVISLLPRVRVREVSAEEVALYDQEFESFVNINTPDDYYKLRSCRKEPSEQGFSRFMQSL